MIVYLALFLCPFFPSKDCTQPRWFEYLRAEQQCRWHVDEYVVCIVLVLFVFHRHASFLSRCPRLWLKDHSGELQRVLILGLVGDLQSRCNTSNKFSLLVLFATILHNQLRSFRKHPCFSSPFHHEDAHVCTQPTHSVS